MSKVYVYTRVSTVDQIAALAQQDRVAMAEAVVAKARHNIDGEIVGPMRDKASAFKLPFHKRPMGKILCEMLQRGDVIVFARLDRFVRLGKDFELQFDEWKQKGVILVFADLGVDMSTAAGGMIARMFSAMSQYFSESLSERQKLSFRERYVHGNKFNRKNKNLVLKVERPGLPPVTIVNRKLVVCLRYLVFRRRYSFLKNGVPDGWRECVNDLERARVTHGDIPEYRPPMQRGEFQFQALERSLHQIMESPLPCLNSERLVKAFREGLNPFKLGRKPSGVPNGYVHQPRQRESLVSHLRLISPDRPPKKAKRWSWKFDCCQACGTTANKHLSRGLCTRCYGNTNGQQTEVG